MIAVFSVAGCSARPAPSPDPVEVPSAFAQAFLTSENLLIPPEIWGFLDPSVTARLRYALARQAAGLPTAWPLSRAQTWSGLRAELPDTPTEAAALTRAAASLPGSRVGTAPTWTSADVATWWRAASRAGNVVALAQLVDLVGPQAVAPLLDAASIRALETAAVGPERLPAQAAREVLDRLGAGEPGLDQRPSGRQVASPDDAARLLLRGARTGTAPAQADPLLLSMATSAFASDDGSWLPVVQAYAAVGDLDGARRVLAAFDQRRILSDGSVLAPPVFSGSVGSTFRMVDHLTRTGTLQTALSATQRDRIATAVRGQLDLDRSHELAGLATLALLDPDHRDHDRERTAVRTALTEEVGSGALHSVDKALAWASIARYAAVLQQPTPFPGLAPSAMAQWAGAGDRTVFASIYTVLQAVSTSGSPATAETTSLAARLRGYLDAQGPDRLDSLTVLGGTLAVLQTTGVWPLPAATVLGLARTRTDECRGEVTGFVRMTAASGSTCDVNATDFALALTARHEADQRAARSTKPPLQNSQPQSPQTQKSPHHDSEAPR